ncbi:hypothetical protein WG915_11315 [Corynebacterium sp. H128]|uniref:hypothetical protein n=1 Tax=unclassified Corynebacterium TaxID=2624378 RepID=UPI0030A93C3E
MKLRSLISPVVAVSLFLSSCGNYVNIDTSGSTAVSLSEDGLLKIHVNTCKYSINRVDIYGSRRPDMPAAEKNPILATYETPTPQQGIMTLPTADQSPWRETAPFNAPKDDLTQMTVIASPVRASQNPFRKEAHIGETSFTIEQLKFLSTGNVWGPKGEISQKEFNEQCN